MKQSGRYKKNNFAKGGVQSFDESLLSSKGERTLGLGNSESERSLMKIGTAPLNTSQNFPNLKIPERKRDYQQDDIIAMANSTPVGSQTHREQSSGLHTRGQFRSGSTTTNKTEREGYLQERANIRVERLE